MNSGWSIDNLWLGTFDHDWEDLLDVTTKDHSETTKNHVTLTDSSASMIKCFLAMSMLHNDFIIDQERCLLDQLCFK
jgi:hypothetical protein